MTADSPHLIRRLVIVAAVLLVLLMASILIGLSAGAAGSGWRVVWQSLVGADPGLLGDIIWRLRLPRVLLSALVGATLSLGGLVFQALLRNPLAEPYILGVSGGSAIGAIIGILMGLSRFPGVWATAFAGSLATLAVLFLMVSGRSAMFKAHSLLLSGVMVNAFCSAVIMFLVSLAQDSRLHNIIFWLMGDLAAATNDKVIGLAITVVPCFILIFFRSNTMNLMSLGSDMASTMGVNIKFTTALLLIVTSLMVSATVSFCGLVGFVGLVTPHMLRMILGPDHRLLTPASILGGATFLVICDLLARVLPSQGEIPVGVITALIGAPLFIFLLRKSQS